ncbi:MAG: PilZ domain-containing protein [Candidatus Omnitrophica bacterium]|nr:PilZ domain-containing protein [Candidatus Omnitrophota bacterium]
MKFAGVPSHLRGVFSVSGLDKTFEIYPSEELGLNTFKEDRIIEKIKRKPLRRRFKRLPVKIKVEYKPQGTKDSEYRAGEILDLSAVGAYIMGESKLALHDNLDLKMYLIPKPGEIDIEATVVWLCDKQIQPQYYPGMGVAFSNLTSATQKKILEFIDRNLAFSTTNNT